MRGLLLQMLIHLKISYSTDFGIFQLLLTLCLDLPVSGQHLIHAQLQLMKNTLAITTC